VYNQLLIVGKVYLGNPSGFPNCCPFLLS